MNNSNSICEVTRQLKLVCARLETLTFGIEQFEENNADMVDIYQNLRLDELEHAQVLVLKLTELITATEGEGKTNTDDSGSVFAPGELNYTKETELEEPYAETAQQGSTDTAKE